MALSFTVSLLLLLYVFQVSSWRLEPTEPFPPPLSLHNHPEMTKVFDELQAKFQYAAQSDSSTWRTNITSFSLAVTSASETLWTSSYTAPILGNYTDSRPSDVTDKTYFRIASISKVFTVLAVLIKHQAKDWSLHDPITKYVPELLQDSSGDIVDWESITLETLAGQLSGIPREYGQSDMIDPVEDRQYGFEDPVEVGLPPVNRHDIPPCGENRPGTRPCTRKELLDGLTKRPPLYQPNSRATYSNMAFVLLGLALEAASGLSYEAMIDETIFNPLGMSRARLSKPPDAEGVIPNMTNDWAADIGTYGPTGGIYTTAADLALFVRAVLTNKLLDKSTTNAWFKPHSFSESWSFAYGMPWEIFRTQDLLSDTNRIQTIITKAGGLRGYSSQIIMIPEYNVGIVALVAGDGHALSFFREELLKAIVPIAESIARTQTTNRLSGTYVSSAAHINSSISFDVHGASGLVITSWISNGTDFLARYMDMSRTAGGLSGQGRIQVTPTGTKRGERSEVWRAQFVPDDLPLKGIVNMQLITDVDTFTYAARSVEELVFELDGIGRAVKVELPAFRIRLEKQQQADVASTFNKGIRKLMKPLGLES